MIEKLEKSSVDLKEYFVMPVEIDEYLLVARVIWLRKPRLA